MPYFDVDIEKTDYGMIRIKAEDKEKAMRLVNEGQSITKEDILFTGSAIRAIDYTPSRVKN